LKHYSKQYRRYQVKEYKDEIIAEKVTNPFLIQCCSNLHGLTVFWHAKLISAILLFRPTVQT